MQSKKFIVASAYSPGALPPRPRLAAVPSAQTWPGTGAVNPSCRRAITSIRSGSRRPATSSSKLLIQFGCLRMLAAQRFELIPHLDRLKMLPGIEQRAQSNQATERNQADAFAHSIRLHGPRQARIVNLLDCKKLAHWSHSSPCGVPCWSGPFSCRFVAECASVFSATRIFTLRARGLAAISASEA